MSRAVQIIPTNTRVPARSPKHLANRTETHHNGTGSQPISKDIPRWKKKKTTTVLPQHTVTCSQLPFHCFYGTHPQDQIFSKEHLKWYALWEHIWDSVSYIPNKNFALMHTQKRKSLIVSYIFSKQRQASTVFWIQSHHFMMGRKLFCRLRVF